MIFTKGAPAVGTIGTKTSGFKLKQTYEDESKALNQAGVRLRRARPAQLKGEARYSSRGVGVRLRRIHAPHPTMQNT